MAEEAAIGLGHLLAVHVDRKTFARAVTAGPAKDHPVGMPLLDRRHLEGLTHQQHFLLPQGRRHHTATTVGAVAGWATTIELIAHPAKGRLPLLPTGLSRIEVHSKPVLHPLGESDFAIAIALAQLLLLRWVETVVGPGRLARVRPEELPAIVRDAGDVVVLHQRIEWPADIDRKPRRLLARCDVLERSAAAWVLDKGGDHLFHHDGFEGLAHLAVVVGSIVRAALVVGSRYLIREDLLDIRVQLRSRGNRQFFDLAAEQFHHGAPKGIAREHIGLGVVIVVVAGARRGLRP